MDKQDYEYDDPIGVLKKKVESGELTFGELCLRLRVAIDSELRKPTAEIDRDFLNSCQDLLDRLTLSEKYVSKQPQYERELVRYVEKRRKMETLRKRAFTAVGVLVALIVLFVVGDGILHREWLVGDSSKDLQQYEVVGKVVDPNMLEKGKAAKTVEPREVSTKNLEEAESVLGFSPLVPAWYPEGWSLDTYVAARNENWQCFYAAFSSMHHDKLLTYTISKYDKTEEAQNFFEQSEKGQRLLINGWDVYVATNIDELIAIWLDGNCCYALFGALSEDEMVTIIESIQKGE